MPRLPEHWSNPPLYLRFEIALGKMLDTSRIVGSSLLPYLRNVDVQWSSINTIDLPVMDVAESERERFTVKPGDLLVCEGGEIGRAAIWEGAIALCAYQKALHRVRPLSPLDDTRFLRYVLWSAAHQGVFLAEGNPNTIPHLTGEAFRLYRFPRPPIDEQRAISVFLDIETSKIDALVAEQQRLIELLKEKRQAVISHAVIKGLNPDAPMKDSGVEWRGEMPMHWDLRRLESVCEFLSGKAHEPFFDDDGAFICVTSRFVSTAGQRFKRCSENVSPASKHDTLVVMSDLPNGRALAKAYFVSNDAPYAVNQRVCILRPKSVDPKYLYYLVDRTPELLRHDDGMNQTHLSNADFLKPRFPFPPLREQQAISEFLDDRMAQFDELTSNAERAVGLLQARRAALITAAVTGQIDVRNYVPSDAA
jgi:type I restriction enzyme S subunit